MSDAVVWMSVTGSAAMRIQSGAGSVRGEPLDLIAKCLGICEEQRAIEAVDHQAGQLAGARVRTGVVIALESFDLTEDGVIPDFVTR